jgi:NAD(P)-dependent dehydrogenase (short-subunit alcohol dehydrogenase family)
LLLEGKCAVVYGAGGAVGAAVAKAFAAEGAHVALTGRSIEGLEPIKARITEAGGDASAAVVDAFESEAVEKHLQTLNAERGRIDVSFNAVGLSYVIGERLTEADVDTFTDSVERAMRTMFVTGTAAGRYMANAGSGVILTITASPSRMPLPDHGSLGVVGAAIEAFCRQLAVDLGSYGVRVVCLRSAGSPDAPGVDYALTVGAKSAGVSRQAFEEQIAAQTTLKRLPRLDEVGAAAAFAASDRASAITAAVLNVTCGTIVD